MLRKIIFIIAAVLVLNFPAHSGEFSISALLKWYSGKYMYRDITNTSYFYPTFTYKTNKFFISVSFPLISQNSDWVTFAEGGQVISLDDLYRGSLESSGQDHGMNSDGYMQYHSMNWEIGDLFFNGEWSLSTETEYIPAFSITAQFKIPTATTALNLGTGAADYGFGISASKNLGLIYGFWDVGYYFLGDPAEIDFKDPIGFGLGVGLPASNNKVSLVFYYSVYSEILQGIEPPRELFINVNYRLNQKYLLNSGISYGFSESSPKYGFFFGADVSF